ncbi:hypothetical protein M422DRAFT_258713 [Sphaerobolus stellatus SS14]|uniref:Uncharacterized protein n=1 Tax=Sphaerobolus stellatus (strain SS14) TaxID=990650 RepID=A0A0C9VAK5_SPHS4|nr:hypothetical protein M422DRAFT_258713 [Sphaerobolus stellatus SS14]
MSNCHSCKWVKEPFAPAVGEDGSPQGLTAGELTDPPQMAVDPQWTPEVFMQEHPGDQNARVHGHQIVSMWVQSPIGAAGAAGPSMPRHNLNRAPDESDHISPDEGGTENEDGSFTIRASEVGRLCQEYADLMNLKENGEIILVEAMEATK